MKRVLPFLLVLAAFSVAKAEVHRYQVTQSPRHVFQPIELPAEIVGSISAAGVHQQVSFQINADLQEVPIAIYTYSGTGAVFSATLVESYEGYVRNSIAVSGNEQKILAGYTSAYEMDISAQRFEDGAQYAVRIGSFDPFAVAFDGNGGTVSVERVTYTPGSAYGEFPSAGRDGYEFVGWATAQTNGVLLSADSQVCLAHESLYAQWVQGEDSAETVTNIEPSVTNYVVTFNANGGTGNVVTQMFSYGEAQALTSNSFVRAGYGFRGWATSVSGSAVYSDGQVVSNLTSTADATVELYASWGLSDSSIQTQMVGGVLWHYTVSGDYATVQNVVGSNYVAAVDVSLSGSLAIPDKLGGYAVEEIGERAFYGCSSITNILIPPTVTSIGSYAFAGCSSLSPGITIPENVETVGSYVFQGCTKLKVVRYLGDCPTADAAYYAGAPARLISGVLSVRTGWGKSESEIDVPTGSSIDDGGETVDDDGESSYDGGSSDGGTTVSISSYSPWPEGGYQRSVVKWVGVKLFALQFRSNGGAQFDEGDGMEIRYYVPGRVVGDLPEPMHPNEDVEFVGWYTASAGGRLFTEDDIMDRSYVLYAHWQSSLQRGASDWTDELYDAEEPFAMAKSARFDGYVYTGDGSNTVDSSMIGLVSVNVARGRFNREEDATNAAVTATVQLLGGGKIAFKGTMGDDGTVELFDRSEEHSLSLNVGENGFSGTFDGDGVSGARNRFLVKSGDDAYACKFALQKWQRTWNVVLMTTDATGAGAAFARGYSVLTVAVGAKGNTKVKGTMADGTKVSASTQLIVGDNCCCIPVLAPMYSGKRGGLAFVLWLSPEYESVWGLSEWNAQSRASGAFTAALESVGFCEPGQSSVVENGTAEFVLEDEFEFDGADVLSEYLPEGVPIGVSGVKWSAPKPGRVRYVNAEEDFVATSDENPSGLALTYTAKSGTFKGSFKVYVAVSDTRLKSYTATVTGAVVDGVGYGTATIKKAGSQPVRIESSVTGE